jgi:hypothetical protein
VTSSDFGQAVMENWQSEFLQFAVFILATVWLVQRGSAESKTPEEAGPESDQKEKVGVYAGADAPQWARARGWRTALYSHSLLLAMVAIFVGAWFAQSVTAWTLYNDEQREHGQQAIAWARYLVNADPGRRRCRTGSRSSSRWGRWPSSRSTSASEARPSRSRSAHPTARRRRTDNRRKSRYAHDFPRITSYGMPRCARHDSNMRPLPPQGSALSPELRARGVLV